MKNLSNTLETEGMQFCLMANKLPEFVTQILRDGKVSIRFIKADGTDRVMKCTLNENLIPAQDGEDIKKRTKVPNDFVQVVWDLEKNAWRSFRWDSLIDFERAQ